MEFCNRSTQTMVVTTIFQSTAKKAKKRYIGETKFKILGDLCNLSDKLNQMLIYSNNSS